MSTNEFTVDQVAQHNTPQSLWITVNDNVYDLTTFQNTHPGGKKVLSKVAGQNATKQFNQFHNDAIMNQHHSKLCIGKIVEPKQKLSSLTPVEPKKPVKREEEESETSTLEGLSQGDTFGELVPYGDPYWYQDWYSPYYNESHRKLRAVTRAFVEKNIMPFCFEWDENKKIPSHVFVDAAKAGILPAICGAPWSKYAVYPPAAGIKPEEFDPFHEFVVCDELSRCGSGGVLWGLIGGLGIGLPPIIAFGSEQIKARIIPAVLSGEKFICLAVTEPGAGSDVANIQTEAKKTPDGKHFILNGEKKWITNGMYADYFTVACRTGGEGMGGISLLLVEKTMPGITARHMQCSGVWASGTSYLTFDDVKVPYENLIGQENKGFKCLMYNFNHERMGICVQATRFARVCLEESIKYAHKRRTFGKKLIDHPVIRNKLAHMARKVEATHAWMESLIYQTLKMDKPLQMMKLGGPIALLKAQSTQTFEYCAREAAQIFGGLSYSRGGQGEKVERLYREVRAYAIPGGSEEIMLDLGIRQSIKVAELSGAKL